MEFTYYCPIEIEYPRVVSRGKPVDYQFIEGNTYTITTHQKKVGGSRSGAILEHSRIEGEFIICRYGYYRVENFSVFFGKKEVQKILFFSNLNNLWKRLK